MRRSMLCWKGDPVIVFPVRNVHSALPEALQMLKRDGISRPSRNGPVLQYPVPVATVYSHPQERVMFHDWRDANPFFHFYESLWMLAGRKDIAPLTRYVGRIKDYSDDGNTFNAAYGHRWRQASLGVSYPQGHLVDGKGPVVFARDQLGTIIAMLAANREDRRQVLQIWEHSQDLGTKTNDAACNLTVTFQSDPRDNDILNMVVFNRSNDIIWGCYGANAVHFSMLMEYVAAFSGMKMGTYTQISVNWHAYENVFEKMIDKTRPPKWGTESSPYGLEVEPFPMLESVSEGRIPADDDGPERIGYVVGEDDSRCLLYATPFRALEVAQNHWDRDCRAFVTTDGRLSQYIHRSDYRHRFFRDVAWPIVAAHDLYKEGEIIKAIDMLNCECVASDWRKACTEWLHRRIK